MKRLDRLVIKSFLGPLVLTFAIAVFVLLMQFIWKYVDDIAGKGLSIGVIAELLLDASATFVPMAMPIAVLFASIMTMGSMGEHYELVAVKSGGVPLWRTMLPMGIIVVILTVVAFMFANYVMPSAVLKYRTTLYDITRKKPALNIRPGEYYSEIDGYVIRVNEKDTDGKTLKDITIYDHRNGSTKPDVIVASHGLMQVTPDEKYMLFTLYDGCSYSESQNEDSKSNKNPFTRVYFKRNEITFDLSSFAFDKSDESIFQGGYQMMNIAQLDSNATLLKERNEENIRDFEASLHPESIERIAKHINYEDFDKPLDIHVLYDSLKYVMRYRALNESLSRAERCQNESNINAQIFKSQKEYINRHYIEWHRKFTLSLACIVLFFVGAPFGSVVRKGGLGVPLVASVVFFVIYYVIGMIVEKAVREGAVGVIGMWYSTFVMIPIGLLLTYKATST